MGHTTTRAQRSGRYRTRNRRVRWPALLAIAGVLAVLAGVGPVPGAPALAQLPQSEPASLERVGALDFEPGEKLFDGGALDSEGTYAYFTTFTRPCRVVKVDVKTFAFVDAISLDPEGEGGRCGEGAVIDPDDAYAYFATTRGWLFKIDLATFEPVDALQVDSAHFSQGTRGLMDPQGRFAYFTQGLANLGVLKIDLETFTWVGTVLQGETTTAAVIDPEGRYAYIGTEERPARIFKVDLETFERVDAIRLGGPLARDLEGNPNCPPGGRLGIPCGNEENWLYAAVIDSEGRYAYFGTRYNEVVNKPARVIKIDLETFERVDAIEMLDMAHESSLYAAVIDPSDTYAYFIGDGPGILGRGLLLGDPPPRVIKVDLRTFERVGAIEIDVMTYNLSAPLMDPGGAFVYVGTYTQPAAHVVKVDLAAFEWVDTIRGTLPQDLLGTAVVDPGGDYAYFGTGQGAPSQVVKVDLDTFERVGSAILEDPEGTLNTEEFDSDRVGGLRSGVIDPQGTYGYFGSVTNRGQVAKVNLETLELVDYIWLEEGEGRIGAAVIDPQGRYAYFGTATDPARVVKIDLATFERVDALTLEKWERYGVAAAIDPEGAYAYFLGGSGSNRLVKIDLETFERVGAVQLGGGTRSIVIDPDGAFAYVGASSLNLGRNVAKVDLETFEWVDTLELDVGGEEFLADSAVMDPEGRFAVFGAGMSGSSNTPGVLVSVDLETFEQADTLVLEREFEEAFSGGGGATGALSAVIDPRGGMAYFGMWSTPGRVVKLRVGGPTGEPTPTPTPTPTGEPTPTPTPTVTPTPDPSPTEGGSRGSYPETPDDPYFGEDSSDPLEFTPTQWALRKVQAPQAWQQVRATGFGIRVAVLDSGVDLQHEDLQCAGKLDVGAGSDVVASDSNPDDQNGHGTHVAGIIGACTNNGTGVAGVAPDATLVPVRVLNAAGSGTDAQLIKGLDKAVELGVHVVNMSLGYIPGKEIINNVSAIDAAIGRAQAAGIVVVAAAGNDRFPLCEYPALAEDVICVGATDTRDVKSAYSVFPNKTDAEDTIGPGMVAPGGSSAPFCDTYSENVLSTIPLEFDTNGCTDVWGYANKSGTSMAAPHVAGVAALVYDRLGGDRNEAAAAQVIAAIIEGADDLGAPGYDPVFGWGRLNALKAVQAVSVGPDPTTSPSPTPTPTETASPTPTPTPTETPTASPSPTESGSPSPSPSESPQPDASDVAFTEDSATSGQYSDEALFEARLTDSGGDPIEGAELTFELTGAESSRSFTATTDSDGFASVTPTLEEKPGPYQLTVRYDGDEDQAGDADTTSFVVEKEDSDIALTVEGQGNNKTLSARLSDLDTSSQGIAERTIDFYSDGEVIGSDVTDSDGVASVPVPPAHRGNNRTYEAVFEGDDFYLGSSDEGAGKGKGGNGGNGGGNGGRDASVSFGGKVLLM